MFKLYTLLLALSSYLSFPNNVFAEGDSSALSGRFAGALEGMIVAIILTGIVGIFVKSFEWLSGKKVPSKYWVTPSILVGFVGRRIFLNLYFG